jgi:hypothetical protein
MELHQSIDLAVAGVDAHLNAQGEYRSMAMGDFDGDGISDIVLTSSSGYASLFFGSSIRQHASNSYEDVYMDGSNHSTFGQMTASGDVNGDGLDDILFGSPSDGDGGSIYVVLGRTNWASLKTEEGVIKIEGVSGEGIGSDVMVSDADGDGSGEIFTTTAVGSALKIQLQSETPVSTHTGVAGGCSLEPTAMH